MRVRGCNGPRVSSGGADAWAPALVADAWAAMRHAWLPADAALRCARHGACDPHLVQLQASGAQLHPLANARQLRRLAVAQPWHNDWQRRAERRQAAEHLVRVGARACQGGRSGHTRRHARAACESDCHVWQPPTRWAAPPQHRLQSPAASHAAARAPSNARPVRSWAAAAAWQAWGRGRCAGGLRAADERALCAGGAHRAATARASQPAMLRHGVRPAGACPRRGLPTRGAWGARPLSPRPTAPPRRGRACPPPPPERGVGGGLA